MAKVYERFIKYASLNVRPNKGLYSNTKKQFTLAKVLYDEFQMMGLKDICLDEFGYLYATIPGNTVGAKTIGFCAHLENNNGTTGGSNPQVISDYDGSDIVINKESNIILSPNEYPILLQKIGQDVIVGDGLKIMGSDHIAGVAQVMRLCEYLLTSTKARGDVLLCFTPEKVLGEKFDMLNYDIFKCDFAYSIDGGEIGTLNYENFNAADCDILIKGKSVHPGIAKNKMVNASLVAIDINNILPSALNPAYTMDYEGFNHLCSIEGNVEEAKMKYIIRNHDDIKFKEQKDFMLSTIDIVNKKYGYEVASINMKDTYSNMKDIVLENPYVLDIAKKAMSLIDINIKFTPFRGGTEGARMTCKGIVCPNICNGSNNSYSLIEFITKEDLTLGFDILRKIVEVNCMVN